MRPLKLTPTAVCILGAGPFRGPPVATTLTSTTDHHCQAHARLRALPVGLPQALMLVTGLTTGQFFFFFFPHWSVLKLALVALHLHPASPAPVTGLYCHAWTQARPCTQRAC